MATNRKAPAALEGGGNGRSEVLTAFLANFEQITDAYGRSIQARVSDAGTKALAEHFTNVLNTQANRLSAFVMQTYDAASPTTRAEAEQLLVRQGAVELTRGVSELAAAATSAPALKGISDIIGIIKKIIKFIIKHFIKNPPPWLNDLIELIDEIVAALAGLFGFRLQRDINQTEVDYLRSMYHLARLNAVEQGAGAEEDEER